MTGSAKQIAWAERKKHTVNMYICTCTGKHDTQKKLIYAETAESAKEEAQKRLNREYARHWNMRVTSVELSPYKGI